jgi:hypothetical protein
MRLVFASAFILAVMALLLGGTQAGEKGKDDKPVTLKGKITCAKCDLMKETECMTVIVVPGKDKKDVVYYFDPAADKEHHTTICTEAKKGVVEGVVTTKGDKKIITVKKLTFDK